MIKVYYVTAVRPGDRERRHDLAKFFARGAAEEHKRRRHWNWLDVAVEERLEAEAEQHPAHAEERSAFRR